MGLSLMHTLLAQAAHRSSLLRLPHDLLVQVFKHLDSSTSICIKLVNHGTADSLQLQEAASLLRRSLASAAINSTQLRRAVAAARTSILYSDLSGVSGPAWKSLLRYLAAQGQHVTDLCMTSRGVKYGRKQQSVALSQALAALPNLRRLQMPAYDLPHTLQQLSNLTALQDLGVTCSLKQALKPGAFDGLVHVPQLTALDLQSALPSMPDPWEAPRAFKSSTLSNTALTGLRKLKLPMGSSFEPDLLSSWPRLQHLDLQGLLPLPSGAPGTQILLNQLQQLTQVGLAESFVGMCAELAGRLLSGVSQYVYQPDNVSAHQSTSKADAICALAKTHCFCLNLLAYVLCCAAALQTHTPAADLPAPHIGWIRCASRQLCWTDVQLQHPAGVALGLEQHRTAGLGGHLLTWPTTAVLDTLGPDRSGARAGF
jgi:hypothetical protein